MISIDIQWSTVSEISFLQCFTSPKGHYPYKSTIRLEKKYHGHDRCLIHIQDEDITIASEYQEEARGFLRKWCSLLWEKNLLVLNVGNGWEWGKGIIIDSYCGSFPHSLLSTSKKSELFLSCQESKKQWATLFLFKKRQTDKVSDEMGTFFPNA